MLSCHGYESEGNLWLFNELLLTEYILALFSDHKGFIYCKIMYDGWEWEKGREGGGG